MDRRRGLLTLLWSLIAAGFGPGLKGEAQSRAQAVEPMLIVLSTGQSLSVGVSHWPSRTALSEAPPPNSFTLDFGFDSVAGRGWEHRPMRPETFQGLRPLREYELETPATAMISALRDHLGPIYGETPPALLHMHMGAGGVSLLQLRSGTDNLHPTWAGALQHSKAGDIMVVQERPAEDPKPFTYAINDRGRPAMARQFQARPLFYDNLAGQLRLAVAAARAAGYTPLPHLLVTLTHGQSDVHLDHPRHGYGDQMNRYLDQIAATAADIWGQPVRLSAVLSQTRGYSLTVPTQQLALIEARPDLVLGISESQYTARFPALIGHDYTHLSPRGYRQMGAELGHRLGRAIAGDPVAPLQVTDAQWLNLTRLRLRLSGVRGHLVEDTDAFRAENLIRPPAHMGFGVKGGNQVKLLSAEITGRNEITLQFSARPRGAAQLILGRTEEDLSLPAGSVPRLRWYNATTIRDSAPIGEGPEGPLWNTPPLQRIDWPK